MNTVTTQIPLLGFVGYSGTGKTTLLVKVLTLLKAKNLRVGMIKHAHHQFDIDTPGKDSYRLRQAGAEQMLIASSQRLVLMVETGQMEEPDLAQSLPYLDQNTLDLILVEGFKHEQFPKIEIHRPSLGHPLIFPRDDSVIAIAHDAPLVVSTRLPQLNLNSPEQIVDFIIDNNLK